MKRPPIDDSYKPMTEVERELLLATRRPTVHLVRRLEVTCRTVQAELAQVKAESDKLRAAAEAVLDYVDGFSTLPDSGSIRALRAALAPEKEVLHD